MWLADYALLIQRSGRFREEGNEGINPLTHVAKNSVGTLPAQPGMNPHGYLPMWVRSFTALKSLQCAKFFLAQNR